MNQSFIARSSSNSTIIPMDTLVERDGHCRGQERPQKLLWLYPSDLSKLLEERQDGDEWLVVDVRSFVLYCGKHIRGAQNLSFSPILVRRLLKGAISLDSLITDSRLLTSIANANHVVLYDTHSTPSNTKDELIKLSETLQKRFNGSLTLHVLLGKNLLSTMFALYLITQLISTLSSSVTL